jgi:hypothetical protein
MKIRRWKHLLSISEHKENKIRIRRDRRVERNKGKKERKNK